MKFSNLALTFVLAGLLSACGTISHVQKESPANPYKDFRPENQKNNSVVGIGEPISQKQMKANATITLKGTQTVEKVLRQFATTFNVAVRWGDGVRKEKVKDIIISDLTFDEARAYVEDSFGVQIIREGERRLLVLPSATEARIEEFKPGTNVNLSQVIRGLAEMCDYNLVITENKSKLVNTFVSTSLKNVTCYDAFDALLSPQGLSLVDEGDYYTVSGLPQREWTLDLLEPVRSETQSVSYSSGSGEAEGGEGGQSVGGDSSVEITMERDFWKDLQEDLENVLENGCTDLGVSTSSGGGSTPSVDLLPPPVAEGATSGDTSVTQGPPAVTGDPSQQATAETASAETGGADVPNECGFVRINKNVGLVQMRAPKRILDKADEMIRHIEDIANRRLMVEARVIAVTRDREFDQGSNTTLDNSLTRGSSTPGQGKTDFQITSVASALASRMGASSSAANGVSGRLIAGTLDAAVGVAEEYGTTYELMQPMIEVMDRQRATLVDGRNEKYFLITLETTQDSAGNPETNKSVEERSQFVGLQFAVSAQVSDGDSPHTVAVQVPMTELAREVTVPDGSGSVVPVVTTRLIDQKVRIRDGEIKVIGGLTRTIARDRESGLPIVRDIPAFGKLVNDEAIDYSTVEFIVLLQVRRIE